MWGQVKNKKQKHYSHIYGLYCIRDNKAFLTLTIEDSFDNIAKCKVFYHLNGRKQSHPLLGFISPTLKIKRVCFVFFYTSAQAIKLQYRPRWKNCLHCHEILQHATVLLEIWNVDTSCEEKYGNECFLLKRASCRCYYPQAKSYLLERGGCGQCWEALLMGWLVMVLGCCGRVVIVSGSLAYRKHLALCRRRVPVWGYNRNRGTLACQSHLYELLLLGLFSSTTMVKSSHMAPMTLKPLYWHHLCKIQGLSLIAFVFIRIFRRISLTLRLSWSFLRSTTSKTLWTHFPPLQWTRCTGR